MKRFFLLSVLCTLFACSGDDSSSTNSNSRQLHPPAWSHGTWTYIAGGQEMGLKFTSDNVCNVTNNNATCFKETIALYEDTQAEVSVDEEISDSEYHVEINISGVVNSYHVEKISATQIKWVLNSTSTLTLTKQ